MTVYPKIKLEKLSSKTQEMFTELGIKYSLYDLEIKEMTGLGLWGKQLQLYEELNCTWKVLI